MINEKTLISEGLRRQKKALEGYGENR